MKNTISKWNENNFEKWDIGGRLIFIATIIAFLSLFMKWADMGFIAVSGFQQQGYIFLIFYIYPMIKVLKNEAINKKIGLVLASIAVIGGILFLFSKSIDMFGESTNFASTGLYVYIISAILLFIGIFKRENVLEDVENLESYKDDFLKVNNIGEGFDASEKLKCSNCNNEYEEGAKYCNECGSSLNI